MRPLAIALTALFLLTLLPAEAGPALRPSQDPELDTTVQTVVIALPPGTAGFTARYDHATGALGMEAGSTAPTDGQAGCATNGGFTWAAEPITTGPCPHTWFTAWNPATTALVCGAGANECAIDAINWEPLGFVLIRCQGGDAGAAEWATGSATVACEVRTFGVEAPTWNRWDSQVYAAGGAGAGIHTA